MEILQFMLCGNVREDESLNPYSVCRPLERQQILRLINRRHLSAGELAKALEISEEQIRVHLAALEKAGLVARVASGYKPTFAIFTEEDQERLEPLITTMADGFVKVIKAEEDLIRATYTACNFHEHGFSFADLAYILVGAYIFDYGGLALQGKFLLSAKEMPGGQFIFSALEGKRQNLRSCWIWGHGDSFGPYTFFSHGMLPQKGWRQAFPDLAWAWRKEGRSPEEIMSTMQRFGTILVALYEEPMTVKELASRTGVSMDDLSGCLQFLAKLTYVEGGEVWVSRCPVIDNACLARIDEMVKEIWDTLIEAVVRPHWTEFCTIYKQTAPGQNGIDPREAFNPIHHAIFERALRLLLEQGFIPWPKPHPDEARYAVWLEYQR